MINFIGREQRSNMNLIMVQKLFMASNTLPRLPIRQRPKNTSAQNPAIQIIKLNLKQKLQIKRSQIIINLLKYMIKLNNLTHN